MNKPPLRRPASQLQSSADLTRIALVHAGLKLFGSKGFDGTSTRDIAAMANANIGSIAYHFGGKEGLRAACAAHIVETLRGISEQALGANSDGLQVSKGPEAAEAQLYAALERMVSFMIARPEAGEIVQFVLRELSHPTDALDTIYHGVFEPTHKRLCQIWEHTTGEPAESERTKITVFLLIGQIIYFRIGREAVLRRMGWPDIKAAEASAVIDVVKDNLAAVLRARKYGP